MTVTDAQLMEMFWSGFATACAMVFGLSVTINVAYWAVRVARERKREREEEMEARVDEFFEELNDPYKGFEPPEIMRVDVPSESGQYAYGERSVCTCGMESRPLNEIISENVKRDLDEWDAHHINMHREKYRLAQLPF